MEESIEIQPDVFALAVVNLIAGGYSEEKAFDIVLRVRRQASAFLRQAETEAADVRAVKTLHDAMVEMGIKDQRVMRGYVWAIMGEAAAGAFWKTATEGVQCFSNATLRHVQDYRQARLDERGRKAAAARRQPIKRIRRNRSSSSPAIRS